MVSELSSGAGVVFEITGAVIETVGVIIGIARVILPSTDIAVGTADA